MNDPARMGDLEDASGLDHVIDGLGNAQLPLLLDDSVEVESLGLAHHIGVPLVSACLAGCFRIAHPAR